MELDNSIPCAVFGASGYSGVELAWLLHNHPYFVLKHAYSSSAREEAEPLAGLYPQIAGQLDIILQPWHPDLLPQLAQHVRVVFLALPHEASAELAPILIKAGLIVFDLSGAFRIRDPQQHQQNYDFEQPNIGVDSIPYGLAEWTVLQGNEPLVAVPGCYPTAAALALKPLMHLVNGTPIINAVSGVSGAGRKAAIHTSFCEVSLAAYGVAKHRHQAEISQSVGRPVIFVPHLGSFKRGILATIYAPLETDTTQQDVNMALQRAYHAQPLVRLCKQPPAINDVAGTAFCNIHAVVHNEHVILCVAIDNLLKGAAAQAVQLANMYYEFPTSTGLSARGGVI